MIFIANSIFIFGLGYMETWGIWPFIVGLTLCMGQVYMFETIGCCVNFPPSSQGLVFALVELIGALFAFIQIPIVRKVEETMSSTSNLTDRYETYFYIEVAMVLMIVACFPVLLSIGLVHFSKFDKMDARKSKHP